MAPRDHPHDNPALPPADQRQDRAYHQTLAREWAYGQTYASSPARRNALPHGLAHYNTTRNHSAIGDRPPINRVHQVIGQDS
ncbi:MAG: integrase core domain-containing protein [Solirubrobacteraceae bacterium]